MIRVTLADDQALIRSGLVALLGLFDGISVIAEATDGEMAVATVLADPPDVLLLDVRMPKLSGVEVVQTLAAKGSLPPTLLLTTFEDDAALVAGVRAGARGFLLKGVTAEALIEAIGVVAQGGTYLYAPLAESKIPENLGWREDAFEKPEALTRRELDVLKLMSSGISNNQIALALCLSEGTVRNHASNIFSKLGVADRTRAVLHAIERQIV